MTTKGVKVKDVLRINPKFLLVIYGVLPLGLLLIVIDKIFLNEAIRLNGPSDPHEFLFFTVLFTLPHIIASFFSFFDKEYIETYGERLLKGGRYVISGALLLMLIDLRLTFLVYALYTMTHVFMQQSGIAKSLMRGVNRWHRPWQWSGVFLSFSLYIQVYSSFTEVQTSTFALFFFAACSVYIILAILSAKASKTQIGKKYFWATVSVPIVSCIFLLLDYPVLIIAAPRIIHDFTAYAFYITHDHNRYNASRANIIYVVANRLRLPVILVCPLLSIVLAFPFQTGGLGSGTVYPLLVIISLYHYYIEGFMWRKENLHRKHIHYTNAAVDLL